MISVRILSRQPWRFKVGDILHVRKWAPAATVTIVSRVKSREWPHYLARDFDGNTWRLPQIHLSRSPITDR